MKPPKRLCKCNCGHELPRGRPDMLFIDDAHRKQWLRRQPVFQVDQAVKRGGLANEYKDAARELLEAQKMVQEVAQLLGDDGAMLAECLHGLRVGSPEKRAEYAALLSDLRTAVAGRRKLLAFALDFIDQAEASLLDGQLGEAGDDVLLDVVSSVAGIELTGDDLSPDEEY